MDLGDEINLAGSDTSQAYEAYKVKIQLYIQ